jgi:hypothetical protein
MWIADHHGLLTKGASMNRTKPKRQPTQDCRLSEDWVSVIIGFAIILVVVLFGLTSVPWPLFGVFS